jgi:predicted amidohydrolase
MKMGSNTLTVISFQPCIDQTLAQRPEQALTLLQAAYQQHGKGLYVFPEYYLNHLESAPEKTVAQAQAVPGPATEGLLDFAATHQCTIVVGLIEQSQDSTKPYNTAVLLGPQGVIGCYRKTHLWDLGPEKDAYRECKLFTPGDRLDLFDIDGFKVGVMICADGMFPETARTLALKGADLIVYPNSREEVGIEAEAATEANLIPLAVSNPVGFNGADQCEGTSRIVGPGVNSLSTVNKAEEGWAVAVLDLDEITRMKTTACARTLRRPELYSVIIEQQAGLTHAHP